MLQHISAWPVLIQALKAHSIPLGIYPPVPVTAHPKHQMIGFQVSGFRCQVSDVSNPQSAICNLQSEVLLYYLLSYSQNYCTFLPG
jgi:hypothetical protein